MGRGMAPFSKGAHLGRTTQTTMPNRQPFPPLELAWDQDILYLLATTGSNEPCAGWLPM